MWGRNEIADSGPWRSFLRVGLEYLPRLLKNEQLPASGEESLSRRHRARDSNAQQTATGDLDGEIGPKLDIETAARG